ncbi:reverse transcriptase domain-containing protein [Tanacetum coccineum]
MRTRSQARKHRQQQVQQTSVESSNLEKPNNNPPIVTMADNRTMAQLLEAPTEGYEDAIVIPEITANNFEIKHGLLNLVQNKQFFGNDKEDPHAHVRYFNKITSTMKIPNVPNTSVKLMLFPFSLEGAARIWLEKEPPRSIETWDDLVTKFINKFFPPSKTTNLRNEITRFQQKFDETFYEAWDRFNDLLRGCPHHGFSELHQLDTFYNALNSIDQDSLNSAAGGNFLDKMPRECLKIIESKSKVRQSRNKAVVAKMSTSSSTQAVSSDVAELKDMVRALILDRKNQTPASAPVKAVEQSCVTCGGGHSYQNCPATNSNIYHDNIQEYVSQAAAANFNQANSGYRPPMVSNQIRPPGFPPIQNPHANSQNNFNRGNNFNQNRGNNFNQGQIYRPPVNQPVAHQGPAPQTHGVSKTDFERYVTANDAVLRNMQNQGQNLQSQMANLTDMLSKFVTANTASTSGSGTLPGNTVTNPKEDLKGITTRSGVTIQGPKAVNHDAEVTKDTMPPANNGSTEDVQPPVVQIQSRNPNPEPNVAPVVTPIPKASIPFPSRRNDARRKEKANDQIEKFYEIFRDLSFEISFTDALMLMPKFASTLKTLIGNKEKLSELARTPLNENCSAVILILFIIRRNIAQIINARCHVTHLSYKIFPYEVYIDMACDEYSQEVLGFSNVIASGNPTPCFEPIVSTASPTLTPFGDSDFLLFEEADSFLALEDDPTSSEVDPTYQDPEGDILLLEAILNKGDDKLPVIIAKDLKDEEKAALLKVLKSHKRAIAWKLSDIKGVSPEFCTHKILMEEDYEPSVQSQRRVNPKIHDVIKKEVEKLLDAGLIYPISDSPWVSPVHCVPKKGGMTVITNDENELIPTRLVTGWRVCIDYRKLNEATRKDHFPLPFMDQMLERLAGNEYYCFLLWHSWVIFRSQKTKISRKEQHSRAHNGTFAISHAFWAMQCSGSILIASDWDLPFELMCDASDFAIGAVLGQRKNKHFQPIHYASKTMNEAQTHYTTTEKELLAVVYAFEKFRSYLVMSKSIVYTDHSAIKYLFAKKDAKAKTKSVIRRLFLGKNAFIHSQSMPHGPTVDTMVPINSNEKSSIARNLLAPPSTGATTLSPIVTFVNVKEKLRNVMRCHKTPSKFAKSLTSGALILWGRSRLQEGTSTYSWLLTTCQNGLKQKRSPPMMPELFANF